MPLSQRISFYLCYVMFLCWQIPLISFEFFSSPESKDNLGKLKIHLRDKESSAPGAFTFFFQTKFIQAVIFSLECFLCRNTSAFIQTTSDNNCSGAVDIAVSIASSKVRSCKILLASSRDGSSFRDEYFRCAAAVSTIESRPLYIISDVNKSLKYKQGHVSSSNVHMPSCVLVVFWLQERMQKFA